MPLDFSPCPPKSSRAFGLSGLPRTSERSHGTCLPGNVTCSRSFPADERAFPGNALSGSIGGTPATPRHRIFAGTCSAPLCSAVTCPVPSPEHSSDTCPRLPLPAGQGGGIAAQQPEDPRRDRRAPLQPEAQAMPRSASIAGATWERNPACLALMSTPIVPVCVTPLRRAILRPSRSSRIKRLPGEGARAFTCPGGLYRARAVFPTSWAGPMSWTCISELSARANLTIVASVKLTLPRRILVTYAGWCPAFGPDPSG